jgi:hypothetical protein
MLGASRSIRAAYNAVRDTKQQHTAKHSERKAVQTATWTKASKDWNWVARAASYDAQERVKTEQAIQQRCDALIARELDAREKIMDSVEQMLKFPLAEVTKTENTETGVNVTVIKPTRWTMDTIARLLLAQQKLGDKDSGINVNLKTNGRGLGKSLLVNTNLNTLSDEELESFLIEDD